MEMTDAAQLTEYLEQALPDLLSNAPIRRTHNHVLRWYGRHEKTDESLARSALKTTSSVRRGPTCP
jgi:hypothetical protein